MEHRWGERCKLNIPVQVDCGSRGTVLGVMRDASVSGAFLCTAAQIPLWTSVRVDFIATHACSVDAQVVRRVADGFGLEWTELAPAAIVDLLNAPRPTRVLEQLRIEAAREIPCTAVIAPPPSMVGPTTEESANG